MVTSAWMAATLIAAGITAVDAPDAQTKRPDASDPTVPVPALEYRSALRGIGTTPNDKRTGWREANDRVGAIGGWRVYAREAQRRDEPEPEQPLKPSTDDHTRHGH